MTYRGEANGDLRYSHLWWVEQPTRAGLLGYGPSAADPTTGQIFAADAYVYGASVIEYATGGRDIVEAPSTVASTRRNSRSATT